MGISNLIPRESKIMSPEDAAKLVELVEEKQETPAKKDVVTLECDNNNSNITESAVIISALLRKYPDGNLEHISRELYLLTQDRGEYLFFNDVVCMDKVSKVLNKRVSGGYYSEEIDQYLNSMALEQLAELNGSNYNINQQGVADLDDTLIKGWFSDKKILTSYLLERLKLPLY